MKFKFVPFLDLLENIVDNRGKTCPTSDAGIPLIATNCVLNDHLYPIFKKVRFVDDETYRIWFRDHPNAGDMLFVTKGTPGRVCWVPNPVNFCIAQDMVAIRANKDLVYPKYLFAMLRSSTTQKMIENLHVGTLIPHFKKGDFDKLLLPIPDDFEVQKKIGDLYFDFSEKIEINRQTNATLEAIAQAIFKEWFVEFNFPGATGESVESQLGMIPRGWRAGKLKEIITNYDSKRVPLSNREREIRKGIYPYYGAASILDYIDDFLFDGVYLLMGEDGTVITDDEKPVLQYVTGKFWVNNHTHVLQGKGSFSTEFIYLLLKNTNIKHIVTGAVQPKINQGNMNNLSVVVPDIETLKVFQEIIRPIFTNILEIEQQSTTLVTIRDALLPKLMSGVIEV